MDIETELFEDYSVDEIKRGFLEDEKSYTCLICGSHFRKGEVYQISGKFYDSRKAIELHIKQAHQSVKETLLNIEANSMGISQLQLQLLNFFAKGLSDKEIAEHLGVAGSTIRNHRYKLRERERQNKVFIALMETLKADGHVAKGNSQMDRAKEDEQNMGVSDKERKRVLDKYMTASGRLKSYPSYERSKRIILEAILVNFYTGKKYSEAEIDRILGSIYKDYKMIRSELIMYHYLDRTNTGAVYWLKDPNQVEYLNQIAK